MTVEIYDSYESLSLKAKEIVTSEILQHKSLTICAATGGSPTRLYELICEEAQLHPNLFDELTVLKLDEWGGLPMNDPGTCEAYLQQHLVGPLCIPAERYISFKSDPIKPEEESSRVQHILESRKPIDICILGIGMNGHLALNEPDEQLYPWCHVAKLSEKTLHHPMIANSTQRPAYGLTLGMANILQSKLILLLINGEKKHEITKAFLHEKVSTLLPASFLWLHPNVICLLDNESYYGRK